MKLYEIITRPGEYSSDLYDGALLVVSKDGRLLTLDGNRIVISREVVLADFLPIGEKIEVTRSQVEEALEKCSPTMTFEGAFLINGSDFIREIGFKDE
jgi:hypothetical protein